MEAKNSMIIFMIDFKKLDITLIMELKNIDNTVYFIEIYVLKTMRSKNYYFIFIF